MKKVFHHLARGVCIVDGKVLLAQAIGHDNTFLPGGHVETGESAKVALVREINEETGIDCDVERFLGLVEHKWEHNGDMHYEINQVFKVTSSDLISCVKVNSLESHLQFIWADVTELEQKRMEPYTLRSLVAELKDDKAEIWWESTLGFK